MGDLIASLLPLALGVVMSPLAIMALVAVLLSERARTNGTAFVLGWAAAVGVALAVSYVAFGILEVHERAAPPVWVPVVRLTTGLLLGVAAVQIYRRGAAHTAAMAEAASPGEVTAAAPQLPGWLQKVSTFTPLRSFALGIGIFLLNPVNLSCAVLAALDIRIAGLDSATGLWALAIFGAVAVLPIATPVVLILVRGESAAPVLERVRSWIASHTSTLNAALVLVIAVLQLQKAASALLSS